MAKNKTNGKTAPSEEEIKDAVETVEDTEDTTAVENPKNADESEDSKDSEKSELDKANEQISALSDKLIRNAAEFDNYKKRTAREKEDFYKSAVCETVAPLLPVLDGVKMVKKQFEDALKSIGVEPIEAVGEQFDPEKHNAVMTADSDEDENTVLEEFQKGYIYRDKVVRHSMVKVSN